MPLEKAPQTSGRFKVAAEDGTSFDQHQQQPAPDEAAPCLDEEGRA